jgi:hypothetical protein
LGKIVKLELPITRLQKNEVCAIKYDEEVFH